MPEERKLIGEYLVEKGIITDDQLKESLDEHRRTNRRIGDILVRRGFATEEDIAKALSEQLGFAYVDLSSYSIESEALESIPEGTCRRCQAMPLFKVGDALTVAMANPLDVTSVDELSIASGLRIRPVFAAPTAINNVIDQHYAGKVAPTAAEAPTPEAEVKTPEEVARLMEEASKKDVVKLVDLLIGDAVQMRASDIHLEPDEKGFYCRLRIDGVLQDTKPPPQKLQATVISRIKIMSGMDIAEKRLPQDGRVEMEAAGKAIDLRIATFPTMFGENLSIRILDKSTALFKLEELGFETEVLKRFKEIIYKPYGIVLVVGPTGCGKTTTLYAVLNTINDLKKNIITLEDPIEYVIPRVRQSQINVKAGLTFATGMRAIVRQDPDIIIVGEIRDKETADITVHSALTGHLVFSTLHTNDAPSAATRLIDIGVEPYLAASSLTGVLAQRLVRRLCPKCKEGYKPSREELTSFGARDLKALGVERIYKEVGCRECNQTGYKGRIGIFELLLPDEAIKELIIRKTPSHQLKDAAKRAGMMTLREAGLEKVIHGITSLAEVLRVTEEV